MADRNPGAGEKRKRDWEYKTPTKAKPPGSPDYSPAEVVPMPTTAEAKKIAKQETDKEEAAALARKAKKGGRKSRRKSRKHRRTHKKRKF